ncbi:TolB family protein [Calidifontibacillus oryziterrae]|uniref:TolB family protein n=1 Tax=Calidifontibacillus oryziterrae TaxID=1191699 RepID=UPI0002F56B54|nr:DPP IV N-terminal domain-containing protein [Calidifontibacillus oryziterrae]
MNRKKFNVIFSISVGLILAISLLFGFWKTSTNEEENYSGIGSSVTVSPDNKKIIFSYFQNNSAGLYQASVSGKNVDVLTYPETGYDISAQFSTDGSKIAYIHRLVTEGEEPKQSLYIIDASGGQPQQLTNDDYYVSEAAFSKDGTKIYFLNAGVYTNYSPITGPRPHEFDIYEMNVDGTEIKRLTNYKNYSMSDITVSADGKYLYFQMMNDEKMQEQSDTFEVFKEIYKFSLETGETEFSFVPEGEFGWGEVFGIAFSNDESQLAYSAVTPKSKTENYFKYELFVTNMETNSTTQITNLHSHASDPVFFNHNQQLLFVEQYNWPGKPEKFQLWKVNVDGTDLEKIEIEM